MKYIVILNATCHSDPELAEGEESLNSFENNPRIHERSFVVPPVGGTPQDDSNQKPPEGGFWFIRLFAIGKLQTNKQNYRVTYTLAVLKSERPQISETGAGSVV